MGKFSRIALIVLGGVVALAAVGLICVNLYVQSQGTQVRIQQELSQRLGTPLNIRRISVTPWGGLRLSGITIPQVEPGSASDFLEAKSFGLRVRFLSLFSQRLVIKDVSLVEPKVIWLQNSDGKWRLPGPRHDAEQISTRELSASPPPETALGDSVGVPPATATEKKVPSAEQAKVSEGRKLESTFVPEVRRVRVNGGNFRFLDRTGKLVATFEGVRFRSNVRNGVELRGNADVAKISLRDRFFLEQLRSPLRYDPRQLDLSRISARAGSGEITGHFAMQPEAKDSPFTASVKFRNVRADQIVAEAGGPKGVVQGRLEGRFDATGKTADANALTGTGEIVLHDGQLQQYSLLAALGQVLQIEELTQLHLQEAHAKYHVTPGVVTIDELVLRSPNIRLSAVGTVNFNGKLRLESQLAINEKVRGQLYKPLRENFQPVGDSGYSAVDFQVRGTLERPKSNLVDKVVGGNLKDFVSGFLGGGKKDRSKKKKTAESATTEAESPTPTPAPSTEAVSPAATETPPAP